MKRRYRLYDVNCLKLIRLVAAGRLRRIRIARVDHRGCCIAAAPDYDQVVITKSVIAQCCTAEGYETAPDDVEVPTCNRYAWIMLTPRCKDTLLLAREDDAIGNLAAGVLDRLAEELNRLGFMTLWVEEKKSALVSFASVARGVPPMRDTDRFRDHAIEGDIMGFQMDDKAEMDRWIPETVAFAILSGGRAVAESEVNAIVRGLFAALNPESDGSYPYKVVVKAVIDCAASLLNERLSEPVSVPVEVVRRVNHWILKTMAAVNIANRRPFTHEWLETQCEGWIINGVRGNRRNLPTQADLDLLVKKTITVAREKLVGFAGRGTSTDLVQ